MMKRLITALLLFSITYTINAQNIIEWSPDYTLQLSDFQSSETHIGTGNTFSLNTPETVSFSFAMSNYEFMFTKNFNSKVSCTFNRSAALLVAPNDSIGRRLLGYAQYVFDLNELFARSFRQQLYEKKGVFSSVKFFSRFMTAFSRNLVLGRLMQVNKPTMAKMLQNLLN